MQQRNKPKIIKSFAEIQKLNTRDFIQAGKLKPLDKKLAVSIARKLAEGFENVNLQKEPTQYQYRKARKILDTWFSAQNSGKSKTIRPSKRNRKYYAEFADMPANFKVYSMPVLENSDEFIINRKKKKLIRRGKNVTTEDYLFPSMEKAVENPVDETLKLVKKIERDYDGKVKSVHLKTGRHNTRAVYDIDDAASVVEKWSQVYDNFEQFAFGLRIFTFNGQNVRAPSRLKLKGKRRK